MKKFVLTLIITSSIFGCKVFEKGKKKEAEDSIKDKPTQYQKIIKEASSFDEGLFKIYRKEEKLYFEIPDSLLNRDMLLVSRISKTSPNIRNGYYNAGTKVAEQVIKWQKHYNKILIKSYAYDAVANDSLPISQSVVSNNYAPTLHSFEIKAYNADSSSLIIDASTLFSKDIISISGLDISLRKQYSISRLDRDRSFIESAHSYPFNIEVKHEMTYEAKNAPSNQSSGTISLVMSQSMVLLPKKPMQPRYYDERVGWITTSTIDYGSEALKSDKKTFIKRWRLVPKDPEAYAKGELVEPVKPIVYYLDPATPEKWRKYFIEGIESWQKCFETAGFKNAIIAKMPPSKEEDPDFSPEDIRYNIVRYVASTTRNAIGPSTSDPRSGEIIESDIIWYHNHLRSYRNRYLIETGAANENARSLDTPEEEIGEMMRMVIAHEIGHALGLPHNMKASSAYPVDSLRSAKFTNKYGIAATIMDYARYNYVAQPGDEGVRFIRKIGPYDHYAINWGYRVINNAKTPEEEKPTLNEWIIEKADNPIYQFGDGYGRFDPNSQTENIGNDPVKASQYGLSNLKIVAKHLPEWTLAPHENYDDLKEIYGELLGVWSRYMGHVERNIGGVYETLKNTDQKGAIYQPVSKEDQKRAMNFMINEGFTTPEWLLNKAILDKIEPAGSIERIKNLQGAQLKNLMNPKVIMRLLEHEAFNKKNAYSAIEMFNDLEKGIWKELYNNQSIDVYRRALQKVYVVRLEYLYNGGNNGSSDKYKYTSISATETDIRSIARGKLLDLKSKIQRSNISDRLTTYHLNDILARIDLILNPK